MKLIVGLGNDGKKYQNTYHNLGFLALDHIALELGTKFKKKECESIIAKTDNIILAKPLTYMNLSGIAVKKLLYRYDLSLSDLIIIYDDIDIKKGEIRFKERGSAGTHNGMKSIIYEIESQDFFRIRIGANNPNLNTDLAEYVLSNIPYNETEMYKEVFKKVFLKVKELINE